MIDYFFKFATEAVAIADAAGSIYYSVGDSQWNLYRVIPGLQIWRNSLDVAGVHTFLTGWYGVISLDSINNTLVNHAGLQLAIDREKSKAGQVAIIRSNLTNAVLQDLRFQPVFAGSNYPFGNMT